MRAHALNNPAAGTAQWIADHDSCSTYNPTDDECVVASGLNCKIEEENSVKVCEFDEIAWTLTHSAPEKADFIKNFIRHMDLCKDAGNGGDEDADTTHASCATLAGCEYIAPVDGSYGEAQCVAHFQLITEALPEVEACFSDVVDAAFMYQGCNANIHEVGYDIVVLAFEACQSHPFLPDFLLRLRVCTDRLLGFDTPSGI